MLFLFLYLFRNQKPCMLTFLVQSTSIFVFMWYWEQDPVPRTWEPLVFEMLCLTALTDLEYTVLLPPPSSPLAHLLHFKTFLPYIICNFIKIFISSKIQAQKLGHILFISLLITSVKKLIILAKYFIMKIFLSFRN